MCTMSLLILFFLLRKSGEIYQDKIDAVPYYLIDRLQNCLASARSPIKYFAVTFSFESVTALSFGRQPIGHSKVALLDPKFHQDCFRELRYLPVL